MFTPAGKPKLSLQWSTLMSPTSWGKIIFQLADSTWSMRSLANRVVMYSVIITTAKLETKPQRVPERRPLHTEYRKILRGIIERSGLSQRLFPHHGSNEGKQVLLLYIQFRFRRPIRFSRLERQRGLFQVLLEL